MPPKQIPHWMKNIGNSLLNAAVQSEPVQAVLDGTPRRIADQLGEWFAHLSQNATMQWAPAMVRRRTCDFCDKDSMSCCIACQGNVCLAHAHVSHRAELLCDECVGTVLDAVSAKQQSPSAKAFAFFHLTEHATLGEVTLVYRSRSKDLHPDHRGADRDMKLMNEHYEVLKKYFEHKKVA